MRLVTEQLPLPSEIGNGEHSPLPSGDSRIHVLFLMDELTEMGGAERVMLNMIRSLPPDRFDCSVLTFKIDPRLEVFSDFPCRLHVFSMRRSYDANALRMARKLNQMIRKENIRIVHTFFETSDLWGGIVARLSGVPVIVSSRRDMGILRRRKHALVYRFVNPLFNVVLAVSDQVRRFCIEQDGIKADRVVTLYNGVFVKPFSIQGSLSNLRDSLGLERNRPIVITVGNIRPVKGVDVFIRAAAEVRRTHPQALFLVVGENHDPAHFEELQKLVLELDLSHNVQFYGSSERVPELLAASEVFCLPSRSEGFSNSLIEAMAAKLPCVATDVGGNSEAIEDGANGYVVPSEDPTTLAERISRLLSNRPLAAKLGDNAAETVRTRFSHKAMMDNLVGIYDRLLTESHR